MKNMIGVEHPTLQAKARSAFLARVQEESRRAAGVRSHERSARVPGGRDVPAPRQLLRMRWQPPRVRGSPPDLPGELPAAREERFVIGPTQFWGGPLNPPQGGHAEVAQLSTFKARAMAGSWNLAGDAAKAANGCYFTFDLPLFYVTGHGRPVSVTVETHGALTWNDLGAASYGRNSWGEVSVNSSLNFRTLGSYEFEGYDVVQGFSRTGDWEGGVSEIWQPDQLPHRTCNRHAITLPLAKDETAWIWIYQGIILRATRHHRVDRCAAAVDLTYAIEPFVVTVRDLLPSLRRGRG